MRADTVDHATSDRQAHHEWLMIGRADRITMR